MKTIYKSTLKSFFRRIGMKSGMTVEVHSSLSSLGFVANGAESVITAIKDCIGESGTIVMPAFPLSRPYPLSQRDRERGIIFKKKYLSLESDERLDMGIIPDTFRRQSDVISGGSHHRFAAWGKNADRYAAEVEDFFRIIDDGGFGLLIGVSLTKLSSMHSVEYLLPKEVHNRLYFLPDEIRRDYDPAEWLVVNNRTYIDSWEKLQSQAIQQGVMKIYHLNGCPCSLFPLKPVIRMYEEALKNDPYGFFFDE